MNIVSIITSDIFSRLAGLLVALMLTNTVLVNARSHIDSLLTWIESFHQELQQGGPFWTWNLGYWFVLAFGVIFRRSARCGLRSKPHRTWRLLLIELK